MTEPTSRTGELAHLTELEETARRNLAAAQAQYAAVRALRTAAEGRRTPARHRARRRWGMAPIALLGAGLAAIATRIRDHAVAAALLGTAGAALAVAPLLAPTIGDTPPPRPPRITRPVPPGTTATPSPTTPPETPAPTETTGGTLGATSEPAPAPTPSPSPSPSETVTATPTPPPPATIPPGTPPPTEAVRTQPPDPPPEAPNCAIGLRLDPILGLCVLPEVG